MIIKKTYKYKLRLTPTQRWQMDGYIGTCRFVYNCVKEYSEQLHNSYRISLSSYDLMKVINDLKKEFEWVKETPIQTLQDAVERYDKARKSFFKGGGFPKWAKKGKYNSVTFKSIKRDTHNRFSLPKIGSVKYFNSRNIPKNAKLKRATVIKEDNHYYICVSVQEEVQPIYPVCESQAVGCDWGVSKFLYLSNGEYVENPRWFDKFQDEKKRLQRSLASKKKGGHNWKNVKRQLSRLEAKVARCRKDWQHKVSTGLCNRFGVIFLEDLRIKNMTKSAKGNAEEHGKNVKAKSGLNREILATAPYQFSEMVRYKQDWRFQVFGKVHAPNTSREHHVCGKKGERQSQSVFYCPYCDKYENADHNAAKNILGRGYTSFVTEVESFISAFGVKSPAF